MGTLRTVLLYEIIDRIILEYEIKKRGGLGAIAIIRRPLNHHYSIIITQKTFKCVKKLLIK